MKSNAGIVIKRLQEKLKQKVNELPKVIMNEGQKAFTENFKNEGFEGKKWKDVVNKKKKYGRPILVGRTRRLINSVRISGKVSNSHLIKWATYVPYAAIHNEGFKGVQYIKPHKKTATRTVKIRGSAGFINGKFTKGKAKKMQILGKRHNVSGYSRKINIPKRQFMGIGEKTRRRILEKAAKAMKL